MLESLVTILEPVFHRDFTTSLRGTEPLSMLGMPRRSTKPLPKPPKPSRTTSRMSKLSTYSSALSGLSSGKRKSTRSGRSRLGDRPVSKASLRRRHPSDGSNKSLSRDELEIKVQVSKKTVTGDTPRETPDDASTFTDMSCNMILTVTEAPDEDAATSPTDLTSFVNNLVTKALVEAGKDYVEYKHTNMIEQFGNLTDALGNLVLLPRGFQMPKPEDAAVDSDVPPTTTPRRMKLLQEIAALDMWIPRKSAVETQHHNAWSSYGFQLAPTDTSLSPVHRHHSSFKGTQVKSADFFSTRHGMLILYGTVSF